MIEFREVSKSFGNIEALHNLNFTINPGELVFIVGPSGAGKTTVFRLLIREMKPTSGHILIEGQDITKLKKKDIPKLRQKIGMVFQDYKLLPERTIAENVEVALAIKDINKKEWPTRVQQVLSLVGLANRSTLFPAQLSGGELQRASLARALIINPVAILADEPTGNLDWETADAIMNLLVKINQEGKTIIITSHNIDIVKKYAQRIIELKDGKIIKDTTQKKKA